MELELEAGPSFPVGLLLLTGRVDDTEAETPEAVDSGRPGEEGMCSPPEAEAGDAEGGEGGCGARAGAPGSPALGGGAVAAAVLAVNSNICVENISPTAHYFCYTLF